MNLLQNIFGKSISPDDLDPLDMFPQPNQAYHQYSQQAALAQQQAQYQQAHQYNQAAQASQQAQQQMYAMGLGQLGMSIQPTSSMNHPLSLTLTDKMIEQCLKAKLDELGIKAEISNGRLVFESEEDLNLWRLTVG